MVEEGRNQNTIKFYSPKNYKNGKYILSKYKPGDFAIMVSGLIGGVVLVIAMVFVGNPSLTKLGIVAAIAMIPLVIYFPSDKYFNLLIWGQTMLGFYLKRKKFYWGGIIHEEIQQENQE